MSNLSNQQINQTFDGLLQVPGGITSTLQTVQDGNGNPTGLQLSSSGASVTTSSTFVPSVGGTQITGAVPRLISDGFGDYVSLKDFGAVGNGVTDDTAALNLAIAAINLGTVRDLYIPAGTYIITSNPTTITKPCRIVGSGRRTCHMRFNACNGFNFDLSATTGTGNRYTNSSISEITFLTNSTGKTGLYYKGVQSFAPHDPAIALVGVSFDTQSVYDSSLSSSTQWAIGFYVDNTDEVLLDDCYFNGSSLNGAYATLTTSIAIKVDTCTGLRCVNTQIYQFGTGFDIIGQSEGLIAQGITIVAVGKGLYFHSLVNPANNHVLANSHVSSVFSAFQIENSSGYWPQSCYISNCFFLEAGASASKTEYVAIDVYMRDSVINNCSLQCNSSTTPSRIGVRVNNSYNIIDNIYSLNLATLVYAVDDGTTKFSIFSNSVGTGVISNVTQGVTAKLKQINLSNSTEPTSLNSSADLYRLRDLTGDSMLEQTDARTLLSGSRQNSSTYIDFRSQPSGTASYDARILSTGGSTGSTSGLADLYLYGNIFCSGNNVPTPDNNRSLGSSSFRWSQVYAANGTINTSDERDKQNIEALSIAEMRVAKALKGMIKRFRFKDAVTVKGNEARIHVGVIAQEVKSAFESEGLVAENYGIFCHDTWDEQPEVLDKECNIITPHKPAGDRYGVRYDELLAFIIAAL
jgi:hypothetical protein